MQKLAIIGANDFQNPLILKAQEKGIETHVFAWQCGDVGERTADAFYPISTAEKDLICEKCREIGVDGVVTIGSDFNNITATYVANRLGLTANSDEAVLRSTNKHLMRETFAINGDPSPKSILAVAGEEAPDISDMSFPLIVKPTDRSGSRGIRKITDEGQLHAALGAAWECSWEHKAVVEEFLEGEEFSVEFISWRGEHHFLQLTKKFTTGAPHFVETGHIEPGQVAPDVLERIKAVVSHALDGLGVHYGASHSEIMVDVQGNPRIVEIGSRMGGDCIGSDLVQLSCGIDFVGAVVDVAMGREPDLTPTHPGRFAAIRFVVGQDDLDALVRLRANDSGLLVRESGVEAFDHEITDSSSRCGFFIMSAPSLGYLVPYLPPR